MVVVADMMPKPEIQIQTSERKRQMKAATGCFSPLGSIL
jgi:hypothetical protein